MVRKLETKSNLEQIIEKGGFVAADKAQEKKKSYLINVRMPYSLKKKIDERLEDRIGISKTVWIVEAIQEKLKRESEG